MVEALLVERFKKGDEEAFRLLCDGCAEALRARARRWLGARLRRRLSAADVLQDALWVAFQRRGDFEGDGDGAFRRWVLGIVDMRAREELRRHEDAARRTARREITHGQRPDTAQFLARHPSPSEHAIGGELHALVRRALDALPPDYREVLRLSREEQLTLAEVAVRMDRSREAAKKLYGRALCRFTEVFREMQGQQR